MAERPDQAAFSSCIIPVRWGDMDAYGHVNNTVYFRYFEEARVQLIEKLLEDQRIAASQFRPVIVTASCTFLRPVHYPDTVRVDCFLNQPGRSSFMVHYALFSSTEPEHPACTGESKVVWTDHETGRSVALPETIRALCGSREGFQLSN